MLDQTGFYLRNKKNPVIKNSAGTTNKVLPSFHIEVTEEIGQNGKAFMHRINSNTSRICTLISPSFNPSAEILVEKVPDLPVATLYPKSFYTKIATELCSLNQQELLDNFSDLRICFSANRSQKNYNFQF